MTSAGDPGLDEARRALLRHRLRGLGNSGDRSARPEPSPGPWQEGPLRLSAAQSQLWYFATYAPGTVAYNEIVTLRKTGGFDADAFRWAFNEIVRRHEAWRTSFGVVDGEPCQIVSEPSDYELPIADFSSLALEDAMVAARELVADDVLRPYDLEAGPPLRPHLVRMARDDHYLFLAAHHIVFDGVTINTIVLPELIRLYEARSRGIAASIPPPAAQYRDFASWEQDWLRGPEAARRVDQCRSRLAGLVPPELPHDHPRPARRAFAGNAVPLYLAPRTVARLREIAAGRGASLFHAVAAGYAFWLARYAGGAESSFAIASDLRRPRFASVAGYCLNTVVLRVPLARTASFEQLVGVVRGEVLAALDCAVPFSHLVRALNLPRDPRANPVFNALLALEPPPASLDPAWSSPQMDNALADVPVSAVCDISVELDEQPDGSIAGRLIADSALFDDATARLMAQHLLRVLRCAAEQPDRALGEIAGPDAADRREQLGVFNPAVPPGAFRAVHDLVAEQSALAPDAVAVEVGGQELTYSGMVERAEQIADLLATEGVGRGDVVAVFLGRTIDLVPALLGIMMSGAAYLPLEKTHPASRARFMMADAGARVILTDEATRDAVPKEGRAVLVIEHAADCPARRGRTRPGCMAPDLAYVIYTSGSTGAPKGVQVEHGNLAHLVDAMPRALGLDKQDRVLSVSSYTFDVSVGDIFPTLVAGATLILATGEQIQDPRLLARLIDQSSPTLLCATPTAWTALLAAGWQGKRDLIAGSVGESLPDALASELHARCRGVWNGWGPTEATVYAGGGFVAAGEPVTVGLPLRGTRILVMDEDGRLLPTGVPGEVVIAGRGIARGYINRPGLTASRFVPDGLAPSSEGGRAYRTGDRGRLLADGRLQHLGRLDDQIKLRGFRIEPGEIEAALTEHPGVDAAAVAVRPGHDGQARLIGYVVSSADPGAAGLRDWLRARLPEYMVPTAWVVLPALPRLPSGKLDRAALPDQVGWSGMDIGGTGAEEVMPEGPWTPVQRELARIWSGLTGTAVTDLHATFFDVGGHSLLAARVVSRVESELGAHVPLADFLERGTTIATLAHLVEASTGSPDDGPYRAPATKGTAPS
ncbi:amino acid adenylation domain-containing protein [Hoyosella sp. G463]|uniref:Amino acid adenylation domain-containing protein n=1 Tax=Lolliginicoccus lacisalsi TaxID=2742202 RepID=A0A927J9P6_9ACTN|nr:non-ribosomal peptide synthetase [Lolliginicoccus lacisalsi]MBD8505169.1 amino acid adenylation domain-containing protein [Lolliginicoccus lacisalsi]